MASIQIAPTPTLIQQQPQPKQSFSTDVIIRSIKILDIGYITVIYFTLGFLISVGISKLLGDFNAEVENKKSTLRLFLEIVGHIWLIGVLVYIARNVVELIPFPLNGVLGFEHKRVKELGNAAVFTFVLLFFQAQLRSKLELLQKRLVGSVPPAKK